MTRTKLRRLILAGLLAAGLVATGQSAITGSAASSAPGPKVAVPVDAVPSQSRDLEGDVVREGTPAQQRRAVARALRDATTLPHRLTIVPMYWDATAPTTPTPTDWQELVAKVSDYFADATDSEVVVEPQVTVEPWVRMAAPDDCDELYRQMEQAARQSVGLPQGDGQHVVAYSPGFPCSWAGRASLGGGFIALNGDDSLRVLVHELGHNLGLHHANRIDCVADTDPAAPVPLSRTCRFQEYYDSYDPMGNAFLVPMPDTNAGYLSGQRLRRLGVDIGTKTLPASGEVTLQPLADTGTRLLLVPVAGELYTVELRTAVGRDHWIDDKAFSDPHHGTVRWPGEGLVIRREEGAQSSMINMHPALLARGHVVPAVWPGETLTGVEGLVDIELVSTSEEGARVRVTRTSPDTTGPRFGRVEAYEAFGDPGIDVRLNRVSDDDTGLDKVEVLVDGTVAATRRPDALFAEWSGRLQARGLTPGPHQVSVLATDTAGNTRTWGPREITVDSDPDTGGPPPELRRAEVTGLRAGPVSARKVPVGVAWWSKARCGIARHRIVRGRHHWWAGGRADHAKVTAAPGANMFRVSAVDRCGVSTAWQRTDASVWVDPLERRGRRGAWFTERNKRALGGSELVSTRLGSRFSTVVYGRSVGWVSTTGPGFGTAVVRVDGRRHATVNLRSRRVRFRQQVWVADFATSRRHRVTVINRGAGRHRRVSVDGFTVLR